MTSVELVTATTEHLQALKADPAVFATLIGSAVPADWPEFPEAVDFTIDRLTAHPDEAQWWMHFFLAAGELVGSGGFVGPPAAGVVEIGYEIAPRYRGRGLATAAARALIAKAVQCGTVSTVIAHTLAAENASNAVLRKVGFGFVGDMPDDEQGSVWRWELAVTAY